MSPVPRRASEAAQVSNLNLFSICTLDRLELKRLKEYTFQVAVTQFAESQGWRVQYWRKSAAAGVNGRYVGLGPAGWPDVVLLRGPRMICIECKAERGTVTPEQQACLEALSRVQGVDVYIARPRDAAELMEILQ